MKVYVIVICGFYSFFVSTGLATVKLNQTFDGVLATLERIQVEIGFQTKLKPTFYKGSNPDKKIFYSPIHNSTVTIRKLNIGVDNVTCHEVDWINPDSRRDDCVLLGDALWYGGSQTKTQHWPIQDMNIKRTPYVTGDHSLGCVLENLWFNSQGYSVFVDRQTPLFIRFNETGNGKMCFSASYDEYPFRGASPDTKAKKELKYTVCSAANAKEIFQFASNRWLSKPTDVVDPLVITNPIWSTWARFKKHINQNKIISFAKEIASNGFKGSHFEIDDRWETCYGELEFDTNRFPDAKEMVKQIKKLGFNVSLWIHPYTNIKCPSFYNPQKRQFFVKSFEFGLPLLCIWWNGIGGYLDTTNHNATDHFVQSVNNLRDVYGIDSFKFDSGEVNYLSRGFQFSDSNITATPNQFTRLYAETAARLGSGVEVRVAYYSQHLPIFVRMLDKDSRWDYQNGLQSLIPTALHMSMIGYPFILPDMIGGNNYHSIFLPERELFVRWLQVNVFMPALQFSIVPWQYDQEVVNISKAMVDLHEQYAPLINHLAMEAVQTGNPIVRPLWWVSPEDVNALTAEQQFLLGDDVLVAPVVEKGATYRDIYIPEGVWEDQIQIKNIYTGPKWLRNYKSELHQVPYFIRHKSKILSNYVLNNLNPLG